MSLPRSYGRLVLVCCGMGSVVCSRTVAEVGSVYRLVSVSCVAAV
jgi:hypothetical protein